MSKATLTLEGIDQIEGTVETGGDFARFQADAIPDEGRINGPHEGQLEIDGTSERVIVENYRTANGEDGGCEITLRRIQPVVR
jgi:hypothetical protein